MTNVRPTEDEPTGFDRGYEGHFRRQARMGLRLTPAERLRWLEETMEEMRQILGRARRDRAAGHASGAEPVDSSKPVDPSGG